MFTMMETQLQPKPAALTYTTKIYSTRQSQETWLFAPNQNEGGAHN
jgi:hypothetical protein